MPVWIIWIRSASAPDFGYIESIFANEDDAKAELNKLKSYEIGFYFITHNFVTLKRDSW